MTPAETPTTIVSLRPASQVMDLPRLGSMYASRVSFVRSLTRKMIKERWQVTRTLFDLDAKGHGLAIYRLNTPANCYHCVIFSRELPAEARSDRVIAEAWDITFALVDGQVEDSLLAQMADNVPLQEAGRQHPRVLVLSRANRSLRNFSHFVSALASGVQPDPTRLTAVGYLYRTTAVYGNGKFGIADFSRLKNNPDFNRPFAAELFTVYALRHFSIEQLNHIVQAQSPDRAVKLHPDLQRYLGIGNSTGLGMAPYLINHPQLIQQWIYSRERVLAYASQQPATEPKREQLLDLLNRAHLHVQQTVTEDTEQATRNQATVAATGTAIEWLKQTPASPELYQLLIDWAVQHCPLEAQELINSLLIELYPEFVDTLDDEFGCHETMDLKPDMKAEQLKKLIEQEFNWVLTYSADNPKDNYWFWYRSAEKEEPRLGVRSREAGAEKELPLAIGPRISQCYNLLTEFLERSPTGMVVEFLMANPAQKSCVRRIQTMADTPYGEIRANLWHQDMKPMHLLRTKLSFFGAGRFDPKSERWVRITLFQGAPLMSELSDSTLATSDLDDWSFPTEPVISGDGSEHAHNRSIG